MAYTYALINKDTLEHICANKHVTTEYLVKKGKVKAEKLYRWLDPSDELLPTINQAKRIAAILHIPFAGLYMKKEDIPLRKIPTIKNMRTVRDRQVVDDSALNIAIVDVLFERDFLLYTNDEMGISVPKFVAVAPRDNDPAVWARSIREQFSIGLEEQFKSTSSRQFYLYLRRCIELGGVFVHSFTDVSVEIARGFAVCDGEMPVVGINAEDRPPARSFSIIHELVHVLKRESSVCNDTSNRAEQQEEVFCNAVAGELLVPEIALDRVLKDFDMSNPYTIEDIEAVAKKFSVSRDVIIRRLLDTKRIDEAEYQAYDDAFSRQIEHEKEQLRLARQNGINTDFRRNISREAIDRTSSAICAVLYKGFYEEVYSKLDIAHHLRIDQKHVDKFLAEVAKWNN